MKLKNKKILLAYFAAFEDCPRPKRFYRYFKQNNEVHIASRDFDTPKKIKKHYVFWKLTISPFWEKAQEILLVLGFLRLYNWVERKKYFHNLDNLEQYDFIVVHNINILPLFADYLDRVIFDSREMYAIQDSANVEWERTTGRLYKYLCQKYLPQCYARITVSESIKKLYEDWLGVPFFLIRNCPDIDYEIDFSTVADETKIQLIHHGVAAKNRQLEVMIELIDLLDERFVLNFMLADNNNEYYRFLQSKAKNNPKVIFIPPVKFESIQEKIAEFDIGIYLNRLKGDQNDYCLPNKFFEFIGAGLMIIASGSNDMGDLIDSFELGFYFNDCVDLHSIADSLNRLDKETITSFKKNSALHKHIFTFEHEVQALERSMIETKKEQTTC